MNFVKEVLQINWQGLNLLLGARAAVVTFAPILIALFAGLPPVGIIFGFGAFFVTFADQGTGLWDRLRSTTITAIAVGALTTLGLAVGRPLGAVVPALFVVALLGGLVTVYGQTATMVGRAVTLATDIGFGLALFNLPPVPLGPYFLAGGLITVLSVPLLVLLTPVLQGQAQPSATQSPHGLAPLARQLTPRSPLLRFSLLRAATITAAGAIAWSIHLPRPYWSVIPLVITLQPERHTSLVMIVQYGLGTLVGAGVAALLSVFVQEILIRELIGFAFTFAAVALRQVNYAAFVASCWR